MLSYAGFSLAAIVALCGALLVEGHGYVSNINIAGVDHDTCYGPHYTALNEKHCETPLRSNVREDKSAQEEEKWVNFPEYTDLDEKLATGGLDEGYPVPYVVVKAVSAKAGDLVKIHWLNWPEGHIGPIFNMMASCGDSCTGKLGADLEWFKISQQNYDPQTKTWPLAIPTGTKGIDTKFTLPTNLPSGQYLLSQTLIAMHSHDGAQYYVSAFEIDLQSDGASLPDLTMKIPAMYTEHRNDVTQFRFMVDRPDCYDFGLFRVPGVPVYDGSDSIAGDSNGNGAEEFDDQPLTVPATCPDQVPPPTVVGSILGAPAAGSGKPSSPAASNAPGGKPVTPASQPPKAPPAATPSSQAPPIASAFSPPTGGAPDTSGTSGMKDCQGIWATCNAASASLKDYAASMTAHGKCDTDFNECNQANHRSAKRFFKRHVHNRRNAGAVW